MAVEQKPEYFDAEVGSTALAQFRFVAWSATAAGRVVFPSAGAPIAGVVVSNDFRAVGRACTVQSAGIAKVQAAASTLAFGDAVVCGTAGKAANSSAGDYRVGTVYRGSSGNIRLLSIDLSPIGTT